MEQNENRHVTQGGTTEKGYKESTLTDTSSCVAGYQMLGFWTLALSSSVGVLLRTIKPDVRDQ